MAKISGVTNPAKIMGVLAANIAKVKGVIWAIPLAQEVVVMWSGTLGNIPANWTLCDGGGTTPNLVARFIRGAPAATEAGTTGGADTHTHATMTAAGAHTHTTADQSHTHVVVSAGVHVHRTATTGVASDGSTRFNGDGAGAHQHTTNSAVHSHTMDATLDHTHLLSTDDGRPPYYEVAFIQAGAGAAVAANLIIIWAGTLAAIPAGWSLCDSGDGRPDLRSRFIRGVNTNVTEPGTTGGTATHLHTETAQAAHSHTMDNAAAHFHTFSAFTWTHTHNDEYGLIGTDTTILLQTDTHAGDHTHANSNTIDTHNHNPMGDDGSHAHTVVVASSLPAYYDVAYIINDGGATSIPANGIVVWTGLLANIPVGYNQCDGGDTRPNMLSKFLRGSNAGVDPGGGGGSDTHTHTDQNAGAHSAHSQTSAGAHQHAATNTLGNHTHTTTNFEAAGGGANYPTSQLAAGNHSHTYNSENAHTHTTLSDPGDHTHNPWSTDEGRPAYYEVIFIQKA